MQVFSESPKPPQAPKARLTYDDVLYDVSKGKTVVVKVPLQLAKFDGHTEGEFKCYLYKGEACYEKLTVKVPPGNHAHRLPNGQTMIHGNENWGVPHAHDMLTRPYTRIAEAGQTVTNCVNCNRPTSK